VVGFQGRRGAALLGPGQHGSAVDGVLQLAHVAGPVVALEQLQRLWLDTQLLSPRPSRQRSQK
jgi:hypothetical protein